MIWLLVFLVIFLLALSLRYAWWRPSIALCHPRILMYHMINTPKKGARFNKLRVSPRMFEYQIRKLKEQGWYFAFMSELQHSIELPSKTVFLTFDDGFQDNFLNAHPILQKYSAKATLYLVVDRYNRDWSTSKKIHHNSGELMQEPKLTDSQISKMLESNLWELGGHTLTHANLAKLSPDEKWQEISTCRTQLEELFSTQVSSFAYPFGIYDDKDVELAQLAGFHSAVTTEAGINTNLQKNFRLKRIKISGKDSHLTFWLRMRTGFRGKS